MLLLTGSPAVGKSTIGRALAAARPLGAFVDADDVRQLVIGGHLAPWQGDGGAAQQRLGIRNACALAENLAAAGADVVLADVLTDATAAVYRERLPDLLIVTLRVDYDEAVRRAGTRPRHLSGEEFRMLYELPFGTADAELDVTELSAVRSRERLHKLWMASGRLSS